MGYSLELQLYARNGKTALKRFLKEYCTQTAIYEIRKENGVWHMRTSTGLDYIAEERTL